MGCFSASWPVPDFTSRENIELVLRAREIKNSAAIAMDALKEVVAELADHPAEMSGVRLSGWDRPKVIAGDHRIVLADPDWPARPGQY